MKYESYLIVILEIISYQFMRLILRFHFGQDVLSYHAYRSDGAHYLGHTHVVKVAWKRNTLLVFIADLKILNHLKRKRLQ